MQDGLFPNTDFENRLNNSNFGKSPLVSTSGNASTTPILTKDDLYKALVQSGPKPSVEFRFAPNTLNASVLDTSGRFDRQLPGEDNEDLYAQMQSNWDKAANGTLKGLQLATSTFVQGTLGLAYGLGKVVSGEGMNSFYNNDLSNSLDRWNQATENQLPNYYSKQERDAKWYEPANLFTANFVFDKLIKNAGFSVGALGSGGVVAAGIRSALKAIPLFNTVANAARTAELIEQGLSNVPPLQRMSTFSTIIDQASKSTTGLKNIFSTPTIERTATALLGAATEGGIEALQGTNEWRNAKIEEYKAQYGYNPTGEDLAKINDTADSLGNARFAMNMGLLTATNFIQLPKILGSRYTTNKAIANTAATANNAARVTNDGLGTAFRPNIATNVFRRRADQALGVAGLIFSPSEAFEEASQYAIQKGVDNYFNKAYRGEGANLIESLIEGYSQTFNEKEGMESILLGGLSGGLQQAYGTVRERGITGEGGERARASQSFASQLNDSQMQSDKWVKDMMASAARGTNLLKENEEATIAGDILEVKDNETDQSLNYLGVRIKHGRYDLVKDEIASLAQMGSTPQGIEELKRMGYADENDNVQTFNNRLQTFSQQADRVNNLYQSLNTRYSGLVDANTGERAYPEETIDKMVYAAAKIADYDVRIPQVATSLNSFNIPVLQGLQSIVDNGTVSEQNTIDAVNMINNLQTTLSGETVTSDTKDQLKSDLRDIIEMALRRKEFLKTYEDIKKNPKAFSFKEPQNVSSGPFNIPQADGRRTRQQEIEVGTTYSLNDPILREGNSIILAPKITPTSQTLRGEIETTMPNGDTIFIPLSEFRNYNISTANNDNETIANEFLKSVDKVIKRDRFSDVKAQYDAIPEKTPQAVQEFVNSLNNKELADAIVRDLKPKIKDVLAKAKEEQRLAEETLKNEQLRKELDKQQEINDAESPTVVPPDGGDTSTLKEADENNDRIKAPLAAFLSKEADFYDQTNPKPYQKRRLSFLTNLAGMLGTNKANKIKAIAITKNNEAHYGLKGFVDNLEKDLFNNITNPEQRNKYLDANGNIRPEEQIIVKMYVQEDKGKYFLIDNKGNKLSQLKGDVAQEAFIYGTFGVFHSSIGEYTFSDAAGETNYSNGTPEEAKQADEQLKAWRKQVLSLTNSTAIYPISGVSRGIILRDQEDKPVLQTALLTDKDLSKENLITVPTREGQIVVNDVSLNFPVGRPLLTNGSNVEFLNNRTFEPKEAENLYNLLLQHSKDNERGRIFKYLNSILYTGKQGQLFITNNSYRLGALTIPVTPTAVEKNRDAIISTFQSFYQKTNNKYLKNQPYEEAYVDNGTLKFRPHTSYQKYLLHPENGSIPFLRTKAIRQIAQDDPTIISRYTTLQGNEFSFEQAPVEKPKVPEPPKVEKPAGTKTSLAELQAKLKASNVASPVEPPKKVSLAELQAKLKKPTIAETKVLEQKAKETPNTEIPLPPGEEFSLSNPVTTYSPINVQKELSYIQEKTPFNTQILNEVIKTPAGLNAWGSYKDMVISLYDRAQAGTGYHEVFEGVWKVFTSTQEKENIVKEFRNRKGSFTFFNGETYAQILYSEATEFQAKEMLADEFAQYILVGERPAGSTISKWFRDLWNFIKSIITGQVQSVDQLFANIDAAKYKSVPYNPLSPSESAEYKLEELNYQQQYETVRGVATQLMHDILNPNNPNSVSLTEFEESEVTVGEAYNKVFETLRKTYEEYIPNRPEIPEEQKKGYLQYWEGIKNDWEAIKELTNEYLKTFSIIANLDEENVQEDRTRSENYSNRDYVDDDKYFANDAKNTASRSIKLLFAILPETILDATSPTGMRTVRSNTTYMQQQIQYAKNFNAALYQLIPLNSYEEKMAKLKEMGNSNGNFMKLYSRLMTPSNTTNPNSQLNDWKLKVRFFSVMSKQAPTAFTQFNQADGSSRTGTTNLDSSIKAISQSWIDTLKAQAINSTSKLTSVLENGDLVLNTKQLDFQLTSLDDKIAFLNQLSIPFTKEMKEKLSFSNGKRFDAAVTGWADQLKRKSSYPLDDATSLKSAGNLNTLAELYIQAGNDYESSYYNLEGQRRTKFIATNKISRDVNDINNADNLEALYEVLPHLRQVGDSYYLNNLLFNEGDKTNYQMNIGFIEGTLDKKGKPVPGEKLTKSDRLIQELNQNLSGRYYVLVPADSKTQWLLNMQNVFSFDDISLNANNWQNRWLDQMQQYYDVEKASYERRKANGEKVGQGIFKEISNNYQLEDVKPAMLEFLNSAIADQRNTLEKAQTLVSNKEGSKWAIKNLDSEFLKRAFPGSTNKHKNLTSEEVNTILRFRTVNYVMNNIEMQKIFFGDILEYKDPTKRYKLFMSPREISVFGVPEFNDHLNETMNDGLNEDTLLGHTRFSDEMSTITMSDVYTINENLGKDYNNNNTTDAQGYGTTTSMRQMRLKGGTWTENDETQYQFSMARDRQNMLTDGVLTNFTYPAELQKADRELVAQGDPNLAYFYTYKPIVSGFTEENGTYHPIVDKFSIVPLSYTAIRDTNFRDHYVKMMKQGISYAIMSSGRKVGAKNFNQFYNADGTVNTEPYTNIVQVPFSTFGLQTDTSSKKETQTRGTQITKLAIINLYNAGVPISEEAGKLAQENIALLKEMTDIGYQNLLSQIGATDVDGQFRIVDKTKILNLVTNELLRREVADSIKQQLQLTEDGELFTPFEALPNYQQIKNILYAYVDKHITSPKVNGGPKVQVSGALMEKYGVQRKVVNGKSVYYSTGLKFYTKEEPWSEILLPAWFGKKLRSAGLKWNTEKELMDIIKSSPDANKILSGVGFRIPTQEINSIENFKIAGFLPEEMGDTVVVPEEITTKAGSDFDIDKLNTYLQNIYVDGSGVIRTIPYFKGPDGKSKLKDWYTKELLSKPTFTEETIDEQDFTDVDKTLEEVDRLYKQSIENEYFRNIQDILALPNNFERLVTPNTADDLKGIRNQLVDLAPTEFGTYGYSTIINPSYMLDVRHNGQSVKGLVGIAALAQTGTAVAQLSNVAIDRSKIANLPMKQRKIIGKTTELMLPNNGTISQIEDRWDRRYISDKISQYINGTVDVFNDAFLAQINFNRKTAGIYLMLERMGVPNSEKHPIVSLFMNQPIVRELLNLSNIRDKNNLLDDKLFRDTANMINFSAPSPAKEFPQGKEELVKLLKTSIEKYYDNKPLSNEERAYQQLVIREFRKYIVYSNQLFKFQQATNWDTASLNDSYSVKMKDLQTQEAIRSNIWSSADGYLNSTFINSQREAIRNSTGVFADVLKIENPITQKFLFPFVETIGSEYISADEKLKIMRTLEENLLNYIIQTKTQINNSLESMLVDGETALINNLKQIKKQLKASDDTNTINGNVILNQLIPYIRGKNNRSTKNITLAVKARDVFTKNLYNNSFKELYNNPITQPLARALVKLSFLQSGVSNSPISFKDAIPAELYASTVNVALNYLQNEETLSKFVKSGTFYRNNATNESLVTQLFMEDYPLGQFGKVDEYWNRLIEEGKVDKEATKPAVLWYPAFMTDEYITHIEEAEGENGPIFIKRLFKRATDEDGMDITAENSALFRDEPTEGALYLQVNKWGDDWRAQEHYDAPKMSVFNNGFVKVPFEIDGAQLFFQSEQQNSQETSTETKVEVKPNNLPGLNFNPNNSQC